MMTFEMSLILDAIGLSVLGIVFSWLLIAEWRDLWRLRCARRQTEKRKNNSK